MILKTGALEKIPVKAMKIDARDIEKLTLLPAIRKTVEVLKRHVF